MLGVLIVGDKVMWKGIVVKVLLKAIFVLEITQIEGPILLEYEECAKASIELMNEVLKRTNKVILCSWEMP